MAQCTPVRAHSDLRFERWGCDAQETLNAEVYGQFKGLLAKFWPLIQVPWLGLMEEGPYGSGLLPAPPPSPGLQEPVCATPLLFAGLIDFRATTTD